MPDGIGWRERIRGGVIGLLVLVGTMSFGIYVVVHWVENQVFTTDNWVANVSPLPKEPVVADALGRVISDQLFESGAIEEVVADALPPRAAFLVGPLTSQLQTATTTAAQKVVASDTFHAIWSGSNRIAMNRVIAKARGETPPLQARVNERFDVDIGQVADQVRERLGESSMNIPGFGAGANKPIVISADLQAKQQNLHQFVRTIDSLNAILPMLAITCFLGALACAHRRRLTILAINLSVTLFMLIVLIGVKWIRQQTLDQVSNPENLPAVSYIFDSVTGGLRSMIITIIVLMVLLGALVIIAGNAKWTYRIQSFVHLNKIKTSRAAVSWQTIRHWVAQREYYLWLASFLIVLTAFGFFLEVSGHSIINGLLCMLSLFALIHLVGAPNRHGQPNAPM